jgi:hypothetical protein
VLLVTVGRRRCPFVDLGVWGALMPASGCRVFRPLAAVAEARRRRLVGDPAHAMTPDLGRGAGQATEDAVVPAAALSSGRVDSGVSTLRRRAAQPDGEDRKGGPTYRQACSNPGADRSLDEDLVAAAHPAQPLAGDGPADHCLDAAVSAKPVPKVTRRPRPGRTHDNTVHRPQQGLSCPQQRPTEIGRRY